MMLTADFFARDTVVVAQELLGKVLRVKYQKTWLAAIIIETEAYYLHDKASHASLGYTAKRKALFMPPGTIYMYYSRGGDSLNVSCLGEGNAVLIKAGFPYVAAPALAVMQRLNPKRNNTIRVLEKLCAGQALLCKALGLKVKDWDQKQFNQQKFYIDDIGYHPQKIMQTKRLGIPCGRDEYLPYRFVDYEYAQFCTENPFNIAM